MRLPLDVATQRRRARARALIGLLAAMLIGASACDDPLSPEEQRRLVESVFNVRPSFWWGEFGDVGLDVGPATLDQLPTADIVVEVEGAWVSYRALVVERRHLPDTGHFGTLSRARRILVAWRIDDPRERIYLGGGRFPGPMGPIWIENQPDEWNGYRPHVIFRLASDSSMENRRGTAEFEPVAPLGVCGYPWPDAWLPGAWAPLCERWSYEVAFEAELGKRWNTREGRLSLRMPPQQVPGFRLTGHCDGSVIAQNYGCGEFMNRIP